jgi:two-component system sensor histidine kinase KdpD
MVPLRPHLSIATAALVLVVPVVVGGVIGGFVGGLCSVVAGFLVYDVLFIPPYDTLTVGSAQHWVALGVYVVVMLLVARIVANLDRAREVARRRADNARHLFELSELLLADRPLPHLGQTFATTTQRAFGLEGVALLAGDGGLHVVASAGTPLSPSELRQLDPSARVPVPLLTASSGQELQTIALSATGPPVGLLVLRGVPEDRTVRELLPIVANHLALALERAQLHDRAVHAGILEEVDRLRRALVGAVSHDLRTSPP